MVQHSGCTNDVNKEECNIYGELIYTARHLFFHFKKVIIKMDVSFSPFFLSYIFLSRILWTLFQVKEFLLTQLMILVRYSAACIAHLLCDAVGRETQAKSSYGKMFVCNTLHSTPSAYCFNQWELIP